MIKLIRHASLAVLIAGLSGGSVSAQTTEAQPAPTTDVSRQGGTLSDKLGATNGVIHPQESVDPKMEKAAPSTGTMPVIPPAGSPGGPTDAQPK